MQKKIFSLDEQLDQKTTFGVDESGDPFFFDKKGRLVVGKGKASEILMMGFVSTTSPKEIRRVVKQAMDEVLNDPLLAPSISKRRKDKFFFHAKDDNFTIKRKFIKYIKQMDIKARFIVARKDLLIFSKYHGSNDMVFYDDLVTKLFTNVLYKSKENHIYFSRRGNSSRQKPFEQAIERAILNFKQKHGIALDKNTIKIDVQTPTDEYLLQVVDYLNWIVYRSFTQPSEQSKAYFDYVSDKIRLVWDIYDFENIKDMKNHYNPKLNPFDQNKITPLVLGAGVASVTPRTDDGLSHSKE